jgi:hypothetical protein
MPNKSQARGTDRRSAAVTILRSDEAGQRAARGSDPLHQQDNGKPSALNEAKFVGLQPREDGKSPGL